MAVSAVVIHAMDRVRQEIGLDQALQLFPATGQGVIVAILDRGIDWRNDDFRNEDGSTRIAYIFDLTDDSGAAAPQNPYGHGTVYNRSQIDAALSGGPALPTRDAVGHGTTTTGIAAGGGRNSPNRKYRGIAPDATIISVKFTSDGAPAHDGEPAEAPFWDPARVPIAMQFVKDKAQELGLPCVMLLNVGSIGGPSDGTSQWSRSIDSMVGPGFLIVTAPATTVGVITARTPPFRQVLVRVQDDAGNFGPFMPFGPGTIDNNSQCTLDLSQSSAVRSGTDLTLTLRITFKDLFGCGLPCRPVRVSERNSASGGNQESRRVRRASPRLHRRLHRQT